MDTTNDEIIPRSEVATVLAQAQAESWGPIGTVPIDMAGSCVITKLPSKLTLSLSTQCLIQAAQMSHSNAIDAMYQGSEISGSAQLEIIEIERTEQPFEGVVDKGVAPLATEESCLSKRSIRRIEVWREEVARYSDSESAVSDDSTE